MSLIDDLFSPGVGAIPSVGDAPEQEELPGTPSYSNSSLDLYSGASASEQPLPELTLGRLVKQGAGAIFEGPAQSIQGAEVGLRAMGGAFPSEKEKTSSGETPFLTKEKFQSAENALKSVREFLPERTDKRSSGRIEDAIVSAAQNIPEIAVSFLGLPGIAAAGLLSVSRMIGGEYESQVASGADPEAALRSSIPTGALNAVPEFASDMVLRYLTKGAIGTMRASGLISKMKPAEVAEGALSQLGIPLTKTSAVLRGLTTWLAAGATEGPKRYHNNTFRP